MSETTAYLKGSCCFLWLSLPFVSSALDAGMHTPSPTSAVISEDRTMASQSLRPQLSGSSANVILCASHLNLPPCAYSCSHSPPHTHTLFWPESLPHAFASGEFCLAYEPLLCCAMASLPIGQSPVADLRSEGSQPDLRAQTQLPEGSRVLMCPHPACGALKRNLPQGPRSFACTFFV